MRGRLGALLLAGAVAAGCGYRATATFPEDVETVAVKAFENRSFYPQLGVKLAEALSKQIQHRTPYRLVPVEEAETVVSGTIRDVRERAVSRRRIGAVPEAVALAVTLDFAWRRSDADAALAERRGMTVVGHHHPSRPIAEPRAIAERDVAQRVAERIVDAMRGDW